MTGTSSGRSWLAQQRLDLSNSLGAAAGLIRDGLPVSLLAGIDMTGLLEGISVPTGARAGFRGGGMLLWF